MCALVHSFCPVFIKNFKYLYMIQIYNNNFDASTIICFWVMLMTDIHTQRDQTLKMRFLDSGVLITCQSIEISISAIWLQNNISSTITWVRASNNVRNRGKEKTNRKYNSAFVFTLIHCRLDFFHKVISIFAFFKKLLLLYFILDKLSF